MAFEPVGNFQRSWESVRGWIDRPTVLPTYGTAAALLALQADMLAYVDAMGPEPTLVIGAGIPSSWLAHTMRVQGISTRFGTVDWQWKDGVMDVALSGAPIPVRLGTAFASGTLVNVTESR